MSKSAQRTLRSRIVGTGAAVVGGLLLVLGSAIPASATITAPSTVTDNTLATVSGTAPAGATYAAIAWCNLDVALGTACNGSGTNASAFVAVTGGSYSGQIRPQDAFTNTSFGGLPVTSGSTACVDTVGDDQCGFVVSYYTGTPATLSHITGADESFAASF